MVMRGAEKRAVRSHIASNDHCGQNNNDGNGVNHRRRKHYYGGSGVKRRVQTLRSRRNGSLTVVAGVQISTLECTFRLGRLACREKPAISICACTL